MTRRTRGFSLQQLVKEVKPYIMGWRVYFGFCQISTPPHIAFITRHRRSRRAASRFLRRRRASAPRAALAIGATCEGPPERPRLLLALVASRESPEGRGRTANRCRTVAAKVSALASASRVLAEVARVLDGGRGVAGDVARSARKAGGSSPLEIISRAMRDVPEFVRQHPAKFIGVIGFVEERAQYVDAAAGQGESVGRSWCCDTVTVNGALRPPAPASLTARSFSAA